MKPLHLFILILFPVFVCAKSGDLRRIKKYEPLGIADACVVDAVLFEGWFSKQFPSEFVERVEFPEDLAEPNLRHEVVIFTLDGKYYAWDRKYSALPLAGPCDSQSSRQDAAATAYRSVRRQTDRRSFNDLGPGSTNGNVYSRIREYFPAVMVRYSRMEYVAFFTPLKDGGYTVNLFNSDVGTRRATCLASVPRMDALRAALRGFFDGDGFGTILDGNLGGPASQ